MFTHVMNLTMNAAIFRFGPPGAAPRPAKPRKVRATPRASQVQAGNSGGSGVPATVRIYADAFNTAVYGG